MAAITWDVVGVIEKQWGKYEALILIGGLDWRSV